ncbi:MAG: dynamin family protein [Bryobacteraceae bacterium]|nr:dynamin family protein [Bryobacteraceae bacterium]
MAETPWKERAVAEVDLLNESQQRRLLANARHADELLSEVESILTAAESRSAFPKYRPDVSLHQARLIRSHIARFRTHLTRVLTAVGVRHDGSRFGALHSIRVTLTFVRIAVQEMAPEYLQGYGDLPEEAAAELRGLYSELEGLLDALERNLALGEAADLQARLDRLQRTTGEVELLRVLDRIVNERELAEFRAPLLNILEKTESRQFEIAVFGRVSSGKSSLLNHVLRTGVLPVGVNPITAVPTRLVYGPEGSLKVTFADRLVKRYPLDDLAQYASEERNPGNELGVTRLVVSLPSPRLRDGLVLVDTPGLGALATAGAAETLAYLPQCDLGIVLISSVNPVNDEDLNTLHALSQAGIPVMVLLSKADLLSPGDREKALSYTQQEVLRNLNLRIAVHPVSSAPGYEELLETWFRDELEPLCSRSRELAQDSARRKTGALLEAMVAALRSMLGGPDSAADHSQERLEQVERGLREAAGRIEETRRFCQAAADSIRGMGAAAIESAAEELMATWNGGAGGSEAGAVVAGAVERTAADAAAQISSRLRSLARELESALRLAAGEFGGSAESESFLEECVREMPRFEASLPEADLAAPRLRLPERLARWRLTRELRGRLQHEADSGFTRYGRALDRWAGTALANLQAQFNDRADAYRAQVDRLTSGKSVSAADRERVGRDVAELESFMPGPEPRPDRPSGGREAPPAGSGLPESAAPPRPPT